MILIKSIILILQRREKRERERERKRERERERVSYNVFSVHTSLSFNNKNDQFM